MQGAVLALFAWALTWPFGQAFAGCPAVVVYVCLNHHVVCDCPATPPCAAGKRLPPAATKQIDKYKEITVPKLFYMGRLYELDDPSPIFKECAGRGQMPRPPEPIFRTEDWGERLEQFGEPMFAGDATVLHLHGDGTAPAPVPGPSRGKAKGPEPSSGTEFESTQSISRGRQVETPTEMSASDNAPAPQTLSFEPPPQQPPSAPMVFERSDGGSAKTSTATLSW